MSILKVIGIVLVFVVSVCGGALLGTVIGAIYVPVKIYELITGNSSSDEVTYIDDEI